jgi:uncharacterized protein YidB (DUF937 family)
MGLLEELTAKVTSALSAPAAAATGTATAVAPEDHSGLIKNVLEMINNPQTGGLAGLVKQFQDKGLGNMVSGWISTGPNPPISPTQVQNVLGSQQLQQLASKTGLPLQALTAKIATVLPLVVDHLTPNGQLPQAGGLLQSAMDWFKAKK